MPKNLTEKRQLFYQFLGATTMAWRCAVSGATAMARRSAARHDAGEKQLFFGVKPPDIGKGCSFKMAGISH